MYSEFPSILTHLFLVCCSSVMFAWAFGNRFARWPAIFIGLVACCIGNLGFFRTAPICFFATILIAIDGYSGSFKSKRGQEMRSISSHLALVAILAMLCSEILIIAKDRYLNEIWFAKIYLPGLAGLLLARWGVRRETRKFDVCVVVGLAATAAALTHIMPEWFNDVDMFYFQQNISPLIFYLASAYFCTFITSYGIGRCLAPAPDDSQLGGLANNPMHVSGGKQVL